MKKVTKPSGELIRFARLYAGLSYKQASKKTGSHIGTIVAWETESQEPNANSLQRLAAAYECDLSNFYQVNVSDIKEQATQVVKRYFEDGSYKLDRKASIAVQALNLPEDSSSEEDATQSENPIHEIIKDGQSSDDSDEEQPEPQEEPQ